MNHKIFMRTAAVSKDPEFQAKVNLAKDRIGQIPVPQLILDRQAEAEAKLMIALDPQSPNLEPLARLIALSSGLEYNQFISSAGLSEAINQSWLLIREFFPLDTYGLPSLGMWAWLLRCLLEDTVQEPKYEDCSLFASHDPENITALAKLEALTAYCRKKGLDIAEFEQGYQAEENRIAELLAVEQRWFIEVLPGISMRRETTQLTSVIKDAFDAVGIDLDAHKIPANFQNKVEAIFVPRQFQGASLEEIQDSLPEVKELSNISRDYNEVAEKTSYERVRPKARGAGRQH